MTNDNWLSGEVASFEPELEQTAAFIAALTGGDGWETEVVFQTFDDVKARRLQQYEDEDYQPYDGLALVLEGSLRHYSDFLTEQNRLGAGIFITINQTDGGSRKNANVTKIRSYFVDADDGEPDLNALPPSILVQSRNGRHAYWLAAEGERLGDFKEVQRSLAHALGTDPKVCDLARVMRLPGFAHLKTGEPFRVELLDVDTTRKFDRIALMGAFPMPDGAEAEQDRAATIAHSSDDPRLGRVLDEFEIVSGGNGQWQALCPAHDDHRPSLSITHTDGKLLVKCHAGCEFDEVVAAVGLQPSDFFLAIPTRTSRRTATSMPKERLWHKSFA